MLTAEPDSMLAAMFSGRHQLEQDTNNRVLIDRDPKLFAIIPARLRTGELPTSSVTWIGDGDCSPTCQLIAG